MEKNIEKYSGVCAQIFVTLLDVYQMKDWEMTWSEFLDQFKKEIQNEIEHWKEEELEEDDD